MSNYDFLILDFILTNLQPALNSLSELPSLLRRLDRIRREMSEDSFSRTPEPEQSLPSTPPPWTMEPPPSYDTVMKSQEHGEER